VEYKGYSVKEVKNGVIIEGVRDFDPVHIFECGQCFRWLREEDGSYTGVAKGKAVNVGYRDDRLHIMNSSAEDFADIWFEYFDLGRDYSEIKKLLATDDVMKKAVEFGGGIRLLKQDIWEALISFIISANNRIPMIMKVVASISKEYGKPISFGGRSFYSFPETGELSCRSIEELEACRAGFRCRYIALTSQLIHENAVNLEGLGRLDTGDARKELMRLPGVGPKVADCVLLYSGTKYDAFPTDVWVKRVMEELYIKRNAGFREIQEFAGRKFGQLAGFAQQYLFYYARENKIGAKSKS
jgi:N-glycosylase/DNA lyase